MFSTAFSTENDDNLVARHKKERRKSYKVLDERDKWNRGLINNSPFTFGDFLAHVSLVS